MYDTLPTKKQEEFRKYMYRYLTEHANDMLDVVKEALAEPSHGEIDPTVHKLVEILEGIRVDLERAATSGNNIRWHGAGGRRTHRHRRMRGGGGGNGGPNAGVAGGAGRNVAPRAARKAGGFWNLSLKAIAQAATLVFVTLGTSAIVEHGSETIVSSTMAVKDAGGVMLHRLTLGMFGKLDQGSGIPESVFGDLVNYNAGYTDPVFTPTAFRARNAAELFTLDEVQGQIEGASVAVAGDIRELVRNPAILNATTAAITLQARMSPAKQALAACDKDHASLFRTVGSIFGMSQEDACIQLRWDLGNITEQYTALVPHMKGIQTPVPREPTSLRAAAETIAFGAAGVARDFGNTTVADQITHALTVMRGPKVFAIPHGAGMFDWGLMLMKNGVDHAIQVATTEILPPKVGGADYDPLTQSVLTLLQDVSRLEVLNIAKFAQVKDEHERMGHQISTAVRDGEIRTSLGLDMIATHFINKKKSLEQELLSTAPLPAPERKARLELELTVFNDVIKALGVLKSHRHIHLPDDFRSISSLISKIQDDALRRITYNESINPTSYSGLREFERAVLARKIALSPKTQITGLLLGVISSVIFMYIGAGMMDVLKFVTMASLGPLAIPAAVGARGYEYVMRLLDNNRLRRRLQDIIMDPDSTREARDEAEQRLRALGLIDAAPAPGRPLAIANRGRNETRGRIENIGGNANRRTRRR